MQKLLVGLHGRRRVGKDTAANYLVREHGFTKIAFADALREECANLFEAPDLFFSKYEECKDIPHPDLAIINMTHKRDFKNIAYGFAVYCMHTFPGFDETLPNSPRWVLLNYSDFVKSKYGDDIWIQKWISRFAMCETSVVVPDIRYNSEAEQVRNMLGFVGIIEIFRKSAENSNFAHPHSSDMRINQKYVDDWIINASNQAIFESCIKLSFEEMQERRLNKHHMLYKGVY